MKTVDLSTEELENRWGSLLDATNIINDPFRRKGVCLILESYYQAIIGNENKDINHFLVALKELDKCK